MRIVMYRVGVHREAYHTDGTCPQLVGRLETGGEWAAVPEEVARTLQPKPLRPCGHCVNRASQE